MNEKFNKNAKVEQLTNMFLSRGEEKGLIVKDPCCSEFKCIAKKYKVQCLAVNFHVTLRFVYFISCKTYG